MNPEIEMTCDEYEQLEEEYRQVCADEFDALYAIEQALQVEPAIMLADSDEIPW